MPNSIEIKPVRRGFVASVRVPGSKSVTNRALVCAALAQGRSTLHGALASDDTAVMVDSLRRLGIEIEVDEAGRRIEVVGCGGVLPSHQAELFVGNSGTTVRFLTAAVAIGKGTFRLDGVERMRQRPIEDLLSALRSLGAKAKCENDDGCPPVIVEAAGLAGGSATVPSAISSQYLSGLLLAAPYARSPVELNVEETLVSVPYVEMTLSVMSEFGVRVDDHAMTRFRVAAPACYQGRDYDVEPDASAASYFFAAAAVAEGDVTVLGLNRDSLQGDVEFCDCLERMGCHAHYGDDSIRLVGHKLVGIDVDMNAISDMVQTLAAVALFAEGPTTIQGVAHIRHKESDRIGDLAVELRKLGARVDVLDDGLRITPGEHQPARIETYDDHRMAMSLAVVGLARPGVVILNPECTAKTYPDFWTDLDKLPK